MRHRKVTYIFIALSLVCLCSCKGNKDTSGAQTNEEAVVSIQKAQAKVEANEVISETINEIEQDPQYAVSKTEIDELLSSGALTDEEYQQLISVL